MSERVRSVDVEIVVDTTTRTHRESLTMSADETLGEFLIRVGRAVEELVAPE